MNQITFSNKIHGKVNFTMSDFIAWKAYISDDKPQQPSQKVPEIINLHPQADQIAEPKKGRGRPKKLFQPVIIPEPEPEPIHQHPAPAPEPKPEVKRKVGRPKKILFIGHGC